MFFGRQAYVSRRAFMDRDPVAPVTDDDSPKAADESAKPSDTPDDEHKGPKGADGARRS